MITDVQLGLFGTTNQNQSLKNIYTQLIGLVNPSDTFTVTGHSLGGFLAQIFTANPPPIPVSHAYTFNAPGLDSAFSNLFGLIGSSAAVPFGLNTNLVGQGHTFVSSAGTQLGERRDIFIETSLNPLTNHSIATLTDALALYDLFVRVDPTLSIQNITAILNAVSATSLFSLERGLDGLRTIFQGLTATLTPAENRVAYHDNLLSFRNSFPLVTVSPYHIVNLAGNEQIAVSLARSQSSEGLAYRYALRELNPFVVVGAGYGLHNVGGAFDLYDAQTGQGTMTEEHN